MRNKIGRAVLVLMLHGKGLKVDTEAWGEEGKPTINSRTNKKALLRKEMWS